MRASAIASVALDEPPTSRIASAARLFLLSGSAVVGLVGLLYLTSFFELLMDSTTGLLQTNSVFVAGATGLAVGGLHTVAGPDHLAGLAPMVVGQGHSAPAAFSLGALWGSGHATGQLLIGIGCLLVHAGLVRTAWAESLSNASGIIVGLALIGIGFLGFYEARDFQDDDAPIEVSKEKKRRFTFATYATGVIHGLSPDAIIFIAPALALSRVAAVSHILGVVAGTLVAMGCCTMALSALCRRSPRLGLISRGASSVAVLLGLCISAAALGFSVPLPGLAH